MKVFLISLTDTHNISNYLICDDDNLCICKKFTNDKEYVEYTKSNNANIYFADTITILTAIKNNAVLYVESNEQISGIMMDDYYNSSIINLSILEFNKIPEMVLANSAENDHLLFVFVDSSDNPNNAKLSCNDYSYFIEKMLPYNNMYFLNESEEHIANTIKRYINGTEEIRKNLLENNC